jgi:hypothetical protein
VYYPPSKIDRIFLQDDTREAIEATVQAAGKHTVDPRATRSPDHPAAIILIAIITWERRAPIVESASFSKSCRDGFPRYTVSFLSPSVFLNEKRRVGFWAAAYDAMSDEEKARLHLTGPEQTNNLMTLVIYPRGLVSPMIAVGFHRWHEDATEGTTSV